MLQLFCISIFDTRNVMSHVKYVLYFYISTFQSMCAVPNMAVFCSSFISCFPGMLLRYCLNYFEIVVVVAAVAIVVLLLTVILQIIN